MLLSLDILTVRLSDMEAKICSLQHVGEYIWGRGSCDDKPGLIGSLYVIFAKSPYSHSS